MSTDMQVGLNKSSFMPSDIEDKQTPTIASDPSELYSAQSKVMDSRVELNTFKASSLSDPPELEKPTCSLSSSQEMGETNALMRESLGELLATIVGLLAQMKKDNASVEYSLKMANAQALEVDAEHIKKVAKDSYQRQLAGAVVNIVVSVAGMVVSGVSFAKLNKMLVSGDLTNVAEKQFDILNNLLEGLNKGAQGVGSGISESLNADANYINMLKDAYLKQSDSQASQTDALIKVMEESISNAQETINQVLATLKAISEEEAKTLRTIAG